MVSFNRERGHQDNQYLNIPFTLNEQLHYLSQSKDTAPGKDKITTSMLNRMTQDSQLVVLSVGNMLWESGQNADSWRKEIKLPIPKPNQIHLRWAVIVQSPLLAAFQAA